MRKAISYILLAPILFGIASFIFNLMLMFGIHTYRGELPICNVQGIVEANSKVYVGLGFYNRIQVYNLEGNYLKYINTDNHSKDFDFTIDSLENPIISVIYSQKDRSINYLQENGNQYIIETYIPLQIDRISKQTRSNLVRQPWFYFLWGGPIVPWCIAAIGVFLFGLINSLIIMEVFGSSISKEQKLKVLYQQIFK